MAADIVTLPRQGRRKSDEASVQPPAELGSAARVDQLPAQCPWQERDLPSLVEAFIKQSSALTAEQWERIIEHARSDGGHPEAIDLVRGAAVALALRNILTEEQFLGLYRPFRDDIPLSVLGQS